MRTEEGELVEEWGSLGLAVYVEGVASRALERLVNLKKQREWYERR